MRQLRRPFIALLLAAVLQAAAFSCAPDPAGKHYDRAEASLASGEYRDALIGYSYVVNNFKGSPLGAKSQYKIALIYLRNLNDGKRALAAFSTLYLLYPDSPEAESAREDLAGLYSAAGDHNKALEEYQKLLQGRPAERNKFHYLIAKEYMELGDFKQARVEFEELLKSGASGALVPKIRYQIASTYYLEGETDEAVARYDGIISAYPNSETALDAELSKAKALESAGRAGEARLILIGLKPRYPNPSAIDAMLKGMDERLKETQSRGF